MRDLVISSKSLPTELEVLVAKTLAYLDSAISAATARGYQSDWADFEAFAESHTLRALPAEPGTVACYLAERAGTLKAATLSRRLSAIASHHKKAGYIESPTYSLLVRETFKGIRRQHGTAQEQKRALLSPEIRRIIKCCPDSLTGLRDKALVLISYAAATRRSETAALQVEDVKEVPEGLVLTIRKSKTDQLGASRKVGIPFGEDPATCPVKTILIYKDAAGIREGSLFRGIDQKQRVSPSGLHPDSVGYILKRCAARANMQVEEIAGHSLRSGFVTEASRANVPEYLIRRQSGHKPGSRVFDRYIRLGEMFTRNAAAGLGL